MAATPKKTVSKAPPVTSTFKNDKQWVKQQINQLVKLAGSKGVNGTAKEKKIWSQIDNLRTTLGTLKDSNRRSLVRGDGKMTYPGGKSTRVVKGVMLNDNGARAALNPGGKGAAMPKTTPPSIGPRTYPGQGTRTREWSTVPGQDVRTNPNLRNNTNNNTKKNGAR